MLKVLLIACLSFYVSAVMGQGSDFIHVITHNRTTIITDPSKGENPYPAWGVFPEAERQVRTIKMHITLGNPDSMPTAHWDYCDIISIRRKGGQRGKDYQYEIGRMLTPYGSIFGKGWQWTWAVDVTDFAPLLRDSVEIEYLHTGYEPVTVGWALTIDFEITMGPPVVKPLGMEPIWHGKYKYGDAEIPIETTLKPVSYRLPAGTSLSKLRIQHTGHGMDRPKGCSEFCSRWREIYHNSKLVNRRDMWKQCGDNPLYPQGGTWIYNRANWCPGDLQAPDVYLLPAKPGRQTLSMVMEPYTATENVQAIENISAFLFHYSAPLQKWDVAIEDIIVPSNKQQHFRQNPSVMEGSIVVRNQGSEPLRKLMIHYGTEGFADRSLEWHGQLFFNETIEIALPGTLEFKPGLNQFNVRLEKPNDKPDEWEGDNSMTSAFDAPKILPAQMVIAYKTNLAPQDNFLWLTGNRGDTLWQKKADGLQPNTLYADTIRLQAGNYQIGLADSAGNGLQFWAQPRQGDGYLRLLDTAGRLVHLFESDCGSGEQLSFVATDAWKPDTTTLIGAFSMFPRRTTDKIEMEMQLSRPAPISVRITVDGVLHQQHDYRQLQQGTFTYSLGYLPKGRFVVEAWSGQQRLFTGRVNRD